ncbi:ABC transporter substrate-binding protein [Cyclobacterium xiamenense]|uniref:ABC transporter substrate-binding protein n=1 Tax=Cyclobacterium xiamenense TaxID=1297121 RepID=UPI0035CF0D0F
MQRSYPGIHLYLAINLLLLAGFSCGEKAKRSEASSVSESNKIPMTYAQGFSLYKTARGYTLRTHFEPGLDQWYEIRTSATSDSLPLPKGSQPIFADSKKLVLTATTQIPHLTYLGAENRLLAFPNLDLISSPPVRKRIAAGQVIELGTGPSPDLEKIIAVDPGWVMVSGFGDVEKLTEKLKAASIPVVVNGEFLEPHPLGRAEWIKATGALLGELEAADSIFSRIETGYLAARTQAASKKGGNRPSVVSGTLYKDIWYAPGKDSWVAQLVRDAGGAYVFDHLKGHGSLALNYEFVLDHAREASYWIGAADFVSLDEMGNTNPKYRDFRAFSKGQVYTYTRNRGETGGLMYFEEGYLRPDWVLWDLIKILHPEKAMDRDFHYFQRLHE